MSVAYSTLTSDGHGPGRAEVVVAAVFHRQPAADQLLIGRTRVQGVGHVHRGAMAVLAAGLPGDGQDRVHGGQHGPGAVLGLHPHQRVGVLAAEVVEGRERHAGALEPVHVVGHVAEREVDEERLVAVVLLGGLGGRWLRYGLAMPGMACCTAERNSSPLSTTPSGPM